MTNYFTNTSQTKTANATPVYTLATYDKLMVGAGATLATVGANSDVITGGEYVALQLQGDLFSVARHGVSLGKSGDVLIGASGSINASGDGVVMLSSSELVNAGEIMVEGAGASLGDLSTVTNSGIISGTDGVEGTARLNLVNTGLIEGRGDISYSHGYVGMAISAGGGSTIFNAGTISALEGYGIQLYGNLGSLIVNTGLIHAASYAVSLGSGNDEVRNSGTMDGDIFLYTGNDLFDGSAGHLIGTAFGGDGEDTLLGGVDAERLIGDDGHDQIEGGGGRDTLLGGSGHDTILGDEGDDLVEGGQGSDSLEGGAGIDTLSYAGSNAAVSVSLATGEAEGGHAEGDAFGGFEGLRGSAYNDTLVGSAGNDRLVGLNGDDSLSGGAGNDGLVGGAGNDTLFGGAGKDVMQGGLGSDTFRFAALADSSVAGKGRDTITDFNQAEFDLINLFAIDANTALAGNQAFSFIGSAAFGGVAGELRYQQASETTLVTGDVDGDGSADFAILLSGKLALTAADFVL